MYLAGGTLGYAGYKIIWNLRTNGEKWKCGCLLPSTTEIQRWAKKVEEVAKVLCPMKRYVTSHGKCIEMADYKKPTSTYSLIPDARDSASSNNFLESSHGWCKYI
jgi:hypothetical protein